MPKDLHVISGPDAGHMFRLFENNPLMLGRSRHVVAPLKDLQISRVHCEIELEDGQVHVTDLESGGGTLTGKPPFEGNSLVETIVKIRTGIPAKLRQFQPSIPDRFEAIVLKLIQKRLEDRFQSAAELLKELQRIAKILSK